MFHRSLPRVALSVQGCGAAAPTGAAFPPMFCYREKLEKSALIFKDKSCLRGENALEDNFLSGTLTSITEGGVGRGP